MSVPGVVGTSSGATERAKGGTNERGTGCATEPSADGVPPKLPEPTSSPSLQLTPSPPHRHQRARRRKTPSQTLNLTRDGLNPFADRHPSQALTPPPSPTPSCRTLPPFPVARAAQTPPLNMPPLFPTSAARRHRSTILPRAPPLFTDDPPNRPARSPPPLLPATPHHSLPMPLVNPTSSEHLRESASPSDPVYRPAPSSPKSTLPPTSPFTGEPKPFPLLANIPPVSDTRTPPPEDLHAPRHSSSHPPQTHPTCHLLHCRQGQPRPRHAPLTQHRRSHELPSPRRPAPIIHPPSSSTTHDLVGTTIHNHHSGPKASSLTHTLDSRAGEPILDPAVSRRFTIPILRPYHPCPPAIHHHAASACAPPQLRSPYARVHGLWYG